METSLKQSKTEVKIEGILSSKKLELTKDSKGGNVIKGTLVIKVDDINSIPVGVYATEYTTKGEINKAYAGIETVMKDYKPIAEVGEEAADRIRTTADFNTYRTQNGVDVVNYRSNFFNRVTSNFEPKRKFSAEVYIESKSREIGSDQQETGRVKIKGIAPSYSGINILNMVCPVSNEFDENFAETAYDLFEIGSTYKINGEIVNSRVEKKVTAALGKVDGEVEYKNELVITGSTPAYEEEIAYPTDAIKLAISEYVTSQTDRNNNAAKNEVPFDKKPTAAASGRSLSW